MGKSYAELVQERDRARRSLAACGIALGADFHTLSSEQVDQVLILAKDAKYRKPRNANGSTARYFHARLQRKVEDFDFSGFI